MSFALTILILCCWRIIGVLGQLPPWETQTIEFGWNGPQTSITQCSVVTIQWDTRAGAIPPPTPPYQFVLYREGYSPLVYPAGSNGTYLWQVDVPNGGPYMMSMNDAANGTGGVAETFSVVSDPNAVTCPTGALTPATLAFNLGAVTNVCNTIPITTVGGTPPFTMTVLPDNAPPKIIHYGSGHFDYVLDVPAGTNTFLTIKDANGQAGVSQQFTVGSNTNTSCLTAATTLAPGAPALASIYPGIPNPSNSKSINIGIIIGPAVGGLVVILVTLSLLLFWCKKRGASRRRTGDLTPMGSPNDHMGQNFVPNPYSPPHSAGPLMSEVGWGPGSPPSFRSDGSYHSPLIDGVLPAGIAGFGVPLHPDDPRRLSLSTVQSTSQHSFGALASTRPTSLQSQTGDNTFYDPHSNSMQQRLMSVSLPPGAGVPGGMTGPDHMYNSQAAYLQGRPGSTSSTGSSADMWNPNRMLVAGANPPSSYPSGAKAGEALSRVEQTPAPPPPMYSERVGVLGKET
ncbi:hypothetical protein FRB96_008228 [Tulasnella sp. 330]|nr:hypothetical protein FRB96_008228 [Tulasnella sp. 330]KAG8885325.1 hypothetical protein FRB98_001864 [Tulasnella sp. 332]